jgi:uncharacterized lipoprotein YddW (UPF0748 family)
MRKFLLLLCGIVIVLQINAQNAPKRELRGAWLTTHFSLDWPNRFQTPQQQRDALIAFLDHQKQTGINAFYLQVRSQCDAMYASSYEPWSYYLTNKQGQAPSPLWDPMEFAIAESRKRGMEFHAWFNPYRAVANTANLSSTTLISDQHIARTHPEWMLTVGTVQILNPGLPEVRDYLSNVIMDVVTRYDIDGIHFDDYFYPNGTIPDSETFANHSRGFTNIADWRRDNVNLLIERVSKSIKEVKPWVKFGVSPTGIYRNSTNPAIGSATSGLQHYVSLYADSRKWLQEGWVDYLMPQLYWYIGQPGADYGILAPWWNNIAYGRHIYIGIAAYKVGGTFANSAEQAAWANRSQVPNQVRLNRSYSNIYGEVYFRSAHLRSNPLGFRDSLRLDLYKHPSLLPAMSWIDNIPPAAPASLTADRYSDDSVVLNWTIPAPAVNELDKIRQFVIYRSTNPEIDFENGANIKALIPGDSASFTDKTVQPGTTYYYAVTAVDRLHNESTPTNTANDLPPEITCPGNEQIILNGNCTAVTPDYRNRVSVTSSASEMVVTQSPVPGSAITGRGNNVITLTATDKGGNTGICTLNVLAFDTTRLVITGAYANPSVLSLPANHKMRNVTVNYNDTDNCGPVTRTLTVTSNEPEYGIDKEDVGPDWEIIDEHHVKLRAERSNEGSGRIYTITITVTDAEGNATIENVTVTVPHHVTPRKFTKAESRSDRDEMNVGNNDDVIVAPNPTSGHFTLWLQSSVKESFTVRIIDNVGRVVEIKKVAANTSISFGSNYKPGVYYAEILQGKTRRLIKLIKTTN